MEELPTAQQNLAIGIDIGGTGIKGGIVDLATGLLVGTRERLLTPQPALPRSVAVAVGTIYERLMSQRQAPGSNAALGIAFPAIVHHGVARSAANIDSSWIGVNLRELFTAQLGHEPSVLNDADAAGLAETTYGAGQGVPGKVLTLTLGTGIGSALVFNGLVVPNFELGHLEFNGEIAEASTSAVARERENLSWPEYAARLERYLSHVQDLFSPELIILGGGISKKAELFVPLINLETPLVVAKSANNAGIIGAALQAAARRT